MSANWSDVFVQQHARPPGASTGLTSTRLTTNAPHASAPDTRTGQPQRGSHSQSHGVLYSLSSPRAHAPLAAAQKALRAPHTSSNTRKHSRSASHIGEHSGAQQSPEENARDELQRKLTNSARAHVGRTSSSGSSESSAATKRLTSGRPREPQAAPQRATAAPVDSSARSARGPLALHPPEARDPLASLDREREAWAMGHGHGERGGRRGCGRFGCRRAPGA